MHRHLRHTLIFASASFCIAAHAQGVEAKPYNPAPPAETVAASQRWLSHQHWFCPPNPIEPRAYAIGIKKYMNDMGERGWEVVSFSQVSVNNGYCYVATYKAPKPK